MGWVEGGAVDFLAACGAFGSFGRDFGGDGLVCF